MSISLPRAFLFAAVLTTALFAGPGLQPATAQPESQPLARLEARAVLPARSFAPGPTSGTALGPGPINGVSVPFVDKQPVQGFSAVLTERDGVFLAMADNGFGSLENSADFHLRVYRIRPRFETGRGRDDDRDRGDDRRGENDDDDDEARGTGGIDVLSFFELHDPDKKIPWAITNHFTEQRVLTGADFDIEAMQRAPDGTLWFGDEFGPFLIHTNARGKVLEAPIALPDFDSPGRQIRSPQNPLNEEASALRIMNAVRAHAQRHGNTRTPVFSPWHVMLDDANAATFIDNRAAPPAGSGLTPASSDVFNVASIKSGGYPVVTWTVNDTPRMTELIKLGVYGIISDRPDLLLTAVRAYDANGDGTPGDLIGADGLIDAAKLDAQGHRGTRDLRPENTLPAMEAALDNLMTTLETDAGVTRDGVAVLDHDPYVEAAKCRRTDGGPYTAANQVLVKTLSRAELQARYICDKLFRGPQQQNDPALSPVAAAFATSNGLISPYVMPTLQQLFDFVNAYAVYYQSGPGAGHPDADLRRRNAARVRFNIETKINPRTDLDEFGRFVFAERTAGPLAFVTAVAGAITDNQLAARADIQSFDFRTLLLTQERFPAIRTVYLFGDFPKFADPTMSGSDDGTNLQPQGGDNTPWMAGLRWPYRVTALGQPFRAQRSGGFEGMALSTDGKRLLPLLESPLSGSPAKTLLIHEFIIAERRYSGVRYQYTLEPRGTNIGDFVMFDATRGLVIERDGTQGDLSGFKAVYEIALGAAGAPAQKRLVVDLMQIDDPRGISAPGQPGDVGLGRTFAFPFVTIEDIVVLDDRRIGIINDNNFPFSVGRHAGTRQPDDTEFIILRLERPLGRP